MEPDVTTGQRFRYTGQPLIGALGLYYYKARFYAPSLGRFLQTDPIGSADDLNLYAYAGNSPISFSDPSGLFVTDAATLTGKLGDAVDDYVQGGYGRPFAQAVRDGDPAAALMYFGASVLSIGMTVGSDGSSSALRGVAQSVAIGVKPANLTRPVDAAGVAPVTTFAYTGYTPSGYPTFYLPTAVTEKTSASNSVVTTTTYNAANQYVPQTVTVDAGTGKLKLRPQHGVDEPLVVYEGSATHQQDLALRRSSRQHRRSGEQCRHQHGDLSLRPLRRARRHHRPALPLYRPAADRGARTLLLQGAVLRPDPRALPADRSDRVCR